MKKSASKVLCVLLTFIVGLGFMPIKNKDVKAQKVTEYSHPKLQGKFPLYGGYYRTWHDISSNGKDGKSNGGLVKMDDIPKGTDLVFIFDDWQHEKSPYYDKLKTEYVKKLHEKGSLVIRTLGTEFLIGKAGISKDKLNDYTNDETGYTKLATDLVKTYVTDYGIDGLDIDVEEHNYNKVTTEERQRIHGVFKALGKLIGRNGSDKDKLLIYDTTLGADTEVFKQNYQNFDLVLVQSYGLLGERGSFNNATKKYYGHIDDIWDSFKHYISPKQFMIGFSFYEENGSLSGGRWYDVPLKDNSAYDFDNKNLIPNAGIEKSRAGRYALWQPKDGLKGGIFGYAIERDGAAHPTKDEEKAFGETGKVKAESDKKLSTDFPWSKKLIDIMDKTKEYDLIDNTDFKDDALREQIIKQVGRYRGDIAKYNKDLVFNDSNIQSIEGLEKFEHVNSITLDGLSKLKSIKKENIPSTFKLESQAPNIRNKSKLNLNNLSGLEELVLSDFKLENLIINQSENFKALKKLDLSNNYLDLSTGTNEHTVVSNLIKNIKNNSSQDINISGQQPRAYYMTSEDIMKKINVGESFNVLDYAKVVELYGKRKVKQEEFNTYKESKIDEYKHVSDNLTYNDLLNQIDVQKLNVAIINSKRDNITDKTLKSDTAETFILNYSNQVGQKLFQLTLQVGDGKKVLDVISNNPTHVYGADTDENIKKAFDGKLTSITNENSFNTWNAPGWFAFEVNPSYKVEYFKLFQNSYGSKKRDNDIEKGELQYLDSNFEFKTASQSDKVKELESANWKTAVTVDTTKNIADQQGIYAKAVNNISAKYWRFKFDTVTGGNTNYSFPQIPEIQLLAVKESKVYKVRIDTDKGDMNKEYIDTAVQKNEKFVLKSANAWQLKKLGYTLKGYKVVSGTIHDANGNAVQEIENNSQEFTPRSDVELKAIWKKTSGKLQVKLEDTQHTNYTIKLVAEDKSEIRLDNRSQAKTWEVASVENGKYKLVVEDLKGKAIIVKKVAAVNDESTITKENDEITLNLSFKDNEPTASMTLSIQEQLTKQKESEKTHQDESTHTVNKQEEIVRKKREDTQKNEQDVLKKQAQERQREDAQKAQQAVEKQKQEQVKKENERKRQEEIARQQREDAKKREQEALKKQKEEIEKRQREEVQKIRQAQERQKQQDAQRRKQSETKKQHELAKPKYTGLVNQNGQWQFVRNNVLDTSYTGLVQYNNQWYYVQKGLLHWGVSAVATTENGKTLYYVSNATLDTTYTGLAQHANKTWYYVKNGIVDYTYSGLVMYQGIWFNVNQGVLDWNYTDIVHYYGSWYYVKNGQLHWGIDGFVVPKGNDKKDTSIYYVNNSTVSNYTGLMQYTDGTWLYLNKGKLDRTYSGLVLYQGKWFNVNKGILDWNYTSLVHYSGTWYYVKNGQLTWGMTGLERDVKAGSQSLLYYYSNSTLNTSYTGLVQHEDKTWYYIINGAESKTFRGVVSYGGKQFYVKNGKIDWRYSGQVSYNGKNYTIKNAQVVNNSL